jgi:hypothetical protein
VWHASVAHHGRTASSRELIAASAEGHARRALRGVGDPLLGEWAEVGQRAVHVRRRLSDAEVAATGLAMRDVRGTPEHDLRLAPLLHLLPIGYRED